MGKNQEMIKYNLAEGRNPKTSDPMFYAMAAPVNVVKLSSLADDISKECTVTRHDCLAVISALEEKIITSLQNGQSVRLGMLGSFCPTIRSKATRKAEDFTNACIKGIHASFHPTSTMKFQLSADNPRVEFQRIVPNLVP